MLKKTATGTPIPYTINATADGWINIQVISQPRSFWLLNDVLFREL